MAENINIDIKLRLDEFQRQLEEMRGGLDRMSRNTERAANEMSGAFSKVGDYVKGAFSLAMVKEFGQKLISVRGEMQQLEIAFSTMLGSEEKANALMQQLVDTAAKTPFDMTSIAQGAKQLLAYGTASNEVNDTLVRLGNIASGLSLPLNDLVYLYGTTQTQGRLFTQDVRQFMGRGIPLVDELSKSLGKSTDEINAMVTAGEIGFDDVRKVIENMTNEGGQFYKLMEKQSASLTGQMSNLGDSIDTMFNEIGQSTEGVLSDGISMVNALVENYKTVGRVLGTLIATYGAYNVALKINAALQKGSAARNAIASLIRLTRAVKSATSAQAAFNLVCKANPYVLLATALVGVTSAMFLFGNETAKAERRQAKVNEVLDEATAKAEEANAALQDYVATLRDENTEQWKRIQTYNKLKEAFKGTEVEGALPGMDEWAKMDESTFEDKKDYLQTMNLFYELGRKAREIRSEAESSIFGYGQSDADKINGLSAQQDKVWKDYVRRHEERNAAVKKADETLIKNKKYYEEQIKKLKDEFEGLDASKVSEETKNRYKEQIAQLQKQVDLYDLAEKAAKKQEEAQRKLNDALKEYAEIVRGFKQGKMGEFERQRDEAFAQYDEGEQRFSEMRKLGVDTSEGEALNMQDLNAKLSEIAKAEKEAADDLFNTLNGGLLTAFEQRVKEVEGMYDDLADDIADKFKNDPALAGLLAQISNARQAALDAAADDWGTTQEDNDLRIKKIDAQIQLNNGTLTELQYKEQIRQIDVKLAQNEVAKAQNAYDRVKNEETIYNLKLAQKNLELAKSEKDDTADKKKNASEAQQLTNSIVSGLSSSLDKLATSLESIGNGFADILAGISSGLSGASSAISQTVSNVEKGMSGAKMSAGDYANSAMAAAQGILGIMEMVTSQIAKNKQVTEQWEKALRNAAHEAAMLRIEQLEYQDPNIWGGDSADSKLVALVQERNEINKAAKEAADTLADDGLVQTGTKTILGWKNAAQGALLGMAAGAAAGSLATPIGTAIGAAAGAVTGFLTGLFAGKEKIKVYESIKDVYGDIYDEETMEINQRILADYEKMDDATKQMIDNLEEVLEKEKEVQQQWEATIAEMTDDVYANLRDALSEAFSGGDALKSVDTFKTYLKKQFESVISANVFDSVFGGLLDQMSAMFTDKKNPITSSYAIMESVAGLLAQIPERMDEYEGLMGAFKEASERYKLGDLFSTDEAQEALSGSISSMSEDTASKLNANFMGLKLSAMEINSKMGDVTAALDDSRDILSHSLDIQREIADNTAYCRRLSEMADDIRALKRDGVRLVK